MVSNPPLNSDKLPLLQQINDRPEAMWEIMQEEQRNNEGWLEPLDNITYAVFPTNQYVPEKGEGAHFMVTFDLGNQYAKPPNTPEQSLNTAARQIDCFLDQPDAIADYNMYYGRRDIKAPSMSWRNWHIHCTKIPPAILTPREKGATHVREPGDRLREQYFIQQFNHLRETDPDVLNVLNYASILSPEEELEFPYPFNGVVARLPYMQPEDIAQSFIDIDHLCKRLHRDIFSISVANYDEVAANGWRIPYEMRSHEDAVGRIAQYADPMEREFLQKAHYGITRGVHATTPDAAIYPGPCYSVSLFKDDQSMIYVIDPHSFKRNGGLESLGIILQRQKDGDTNQFERMQRAYDALTL